MKLKIIFMALLIALAFFYETQNTKSLKTHSPLLTSNEKIIETSSNFLDSIINLPLKSLEITNSDGFLKVSGICDKEKIKDFLDEDTYEKLKLPLTFFPDEFLIELLVEISSIDDSSNITIKTITLGDMTFDTNIKIS